MILFTSGASRSPLTTADGAVDSSAVASALLRAVLVAALSSGVVSLVLAMGFGSRQMIGAALGSVLALIAFGTPPLVMKAVAKASPPAVMAAGVGGYLLSTSVLGVAFLMLDPASWVSQQWLGWTLFAGTVAASLALMVSVRRMRLPVFERPAPSGSSAGEPKTDDSP